jgi:thymidylate synthase (FAD)
MRVKLISFTQPPEYVGSNGLVHSTEFGKYLNSDLTKLVAYCARVSNPGNQQNEETSEKLVKYLMKHKHWSPFEMVNVCLEIETTRDIARQILRHRSFTFQEFSQRYADPTKELTFETREARLQDQKNRQNSIETDDAVLQDMWTKMQEKVINEAIASYKWAITKGIAKEVARAVLPEGLTMSRMYVNGTLRSWLHYIDIRADISTQKEHREIALACAEVISKVFPMITELTNG